MALADAGPGFGLAMEGLNDLRRDLRRVDAELPKALGRGHRQFAVTIRRHARAVAGGLPGGRKFAGLIRATGNQRNIEVKYLASRSINPAARKGSTPTMGWLMGSKRYGQFGPWRGNQWTGGPGAHLLEQAYATGPAIAAFKRRALRDYDKIVSRELKKAWPR